MNRSIRFGVMAVGLAGAGLIRPVCADTLVQRGAWRVEFDAAASRLTLNHRESVARIAGRLMFEGPAAVTGAGVAADAGKVAVWKVADSRDGAKNRLALVDPADNVNGYVAFQGDGDGVSMLVYHRTAFAFAGTLTFDAEVDYRPDAFACRLTPKKGDRVLSVRSGDAVSADDDALFSPSADEALRVCGGALKVRPYEVLPKPPESRVIAIQGNHDTGVDAFYRDCAFTAGHVRFITFFASYVGLPPPPGRRFHSTAKISDETIAFIGREMEKAAADPSIRHIVLVSHWAIAPVGRDFACPIVGPCKENGMNDNRARLLALAEKYGCRLFINGHEHNGRYPVGQAGPMAGINCGSVTGDPKSGAGAFAIVEIHPQKAVFNVYSRAAVREDGGACTVTSIPKRLFTREIALAPIRPKV